MSYKLRFSIKERKVIRKEWEDGASIRSLVKKYFANKLTIRSIARGIHKIDQRINVSNIFNKPRPKPLRPQLITKGSHPKSKGSPELLAKLKKESF